jgi:hypothetical protein
LMRKELFVEVCDARKLLCNTSAGTIDKFTLYCKERKEYLRTVFLAKITQPFA